mgnify:CR=1 FL=1
MKEPEVSVCVLKNNKLQISLDGLFKAKGMEISENQTVEYKDGSVLWNDRLYQELLFLPANQNCCFSIENVVIGINFHWQRTETQTFRGALKIIPEDGKICAINLLPVEQYLISVISSEMKATSSLEFLKAHAVISRSWLMAQMKKRRKNNKELNSFLSFVKKDNMMLRWYDRQDHSLFDVCADDHCQRYQGITRADNQTVVEAVNATKGQVLKYGEEICDARFAKCCGGMMELFSTCWEDNDLPYLVAKRDIIENDNNDKTDKQQKLDLTDESQAKKWITSSPKAFCNTKDSRILRQVLNNYDQETLDFYRWQVEYSQQELRNLIETNTKMNFGDIIDLKPVKRGPSGRLYMMQIVGTEKSFIIGKELEIRRVLSDSHLYSSAFIVQKVYDDHNKDKVMPDKFIIKGAGWGHGVGLCQIGAAVMGEKGFSYTQILQHYYPKADIKSLYE